jgi:hypothetical protein
VRRVDPLPPVSEVVSDDTGPGAEEEGKETAMGGVVWVIPALDEGPSRILVELAVFAPDEIPGEAGKLLRGIGICEEPVGWDTADVGGRELDVMCGSGGKIDVCGSDGGLAVCGGSGGGESVDGNDLI